MLSCGQGHANAGNDYSYNGTQHDMYCMARCLQSMLSLNDQMSRLRVLYLQMHVCLTGLLVYTVLLATARMR